MLVLFLTAIALMLVIEGIMPFLAPLRWRRMMARLSAASDKSVRLMGLTLMITGAAIMYLVHSGLLFKLFRA